MQRCLQLAAMAAGQVAPNPMVGAVLVYAGRIIGEGYHQKYGEAHAEVNCINSVADADKAFIEKSTLYVSLEPCAHFGKTPPCADLIIKNNIPGVVIGCRDSFVEVSGKGIEKLQNAYCNLYTGVLEKECLALNKRFFSFHEKQRPYIILKWAQSNDGKIAAPLNPPRGGSSELTEASRLLISNEITNRLVHKWRSEEAAILVGTNTALLDDPSLTTRLYPRKDPLRLVIDRELKLPGHLKLFDGSAGTIVFNFIKQAEQGMLLYHKLDPKENILTQILSALHDQQILSVIVEGGSKLLQSFIDEWLWDEARVITNGAMEVPGGIRAPSLLNAKNVYTGQILTDTIHYYQPVKPG